MAKNEATTKALQELKDEYIVMKLAEGKLDRLARLKKVLGKREFHQELLDFCDETKDFVSSENRSIYDKLGFSKFVKEVKKELNKNMEECLLDIKMYYNHQKSLTELEKGR